MTKKKIDRGDGCYQTKEEVYEGNRQEWGGRVFKNKENSGPFKNDENSGSCL